MQEKSDMARGQTSRRAFLASNGALAAGMCVAGPTVARAAETLAISGGKKAVTAPAADAASWPRFGEEEIEAVSAVVRSFGHYVSTRKFPSDSKYKKYTTGLGLKLRIHPLGAALARCQLRGLDQQTEMERRQNHALNSRLCQLPGLSQPPLAPGVKRVYWRWNNLFIDPAKAGMSRDTAIKALKAEGVKVGRFNYRISHRDTVVNEPGWWHHPPVIPDRLPGLDEALENGISLPRFTKPVPELIDQYVQAFEKVWAHRAELGKT